MDDDNLTYFEKRIKTDLESLEKRIADLTAEKFALQRQLSKAYAERTGLQHTTRKNSMNRVLAENAILDALRTEKKPIHTDQLYRIAHVTNFDLKENTFRVYLHRMKKRGLIRTADHVGVWELTEASKD